MSSRVISVQNADALARTCRRSADRLRWTARMLSEVPGATDEARHAVACADWLETEAADIARRIRAISAAPGVAGSRSAAIAVGAALSWRGTPYVWGGTAPGRGLDCSGLVQAAYARAGVRVPRTSRVQARFGRSVGSLHEARPGDLLFFGSPVRHVAIYLGGGRMVEAPRRGLAVRVVAVRRPVSIRRVGP